jgi:hypothetical protein
MLATDPGIPTDNSSRGQIYRFVIPAAALLLFGMLAALWCGGPRRVYFEALQLIGFQPFRFPFLDIHAVLAAAECQRHGIDIYLTNPCDVLGRVHVYSPLWLTIIPPFLDTSDTVWVGLILDLLFILSIAFLFRPATSAELLALGLTALSPVTVYALERANNDLIVFLLIVAGCALGSATRISRLGSYALSLSAGLLKYYPLVLLVFLARERRRDALGAAAVSAAVVLLLAVCDHVELGKALANIPPLSYFADSFSVLNLPFGFAEAVVGPRLRVALALPLLAIVAAVAVARTQRTLHLVDVTALAGNHYEAQCLAAGVLLLITCFFAGQNVDYRGVYFLLLMPGLMRLYREAEDATRRKFVARMITAIALLSWEEFFRHAVHAMAAVFASNWLRLRVEFLFWIGRELAWWWVIAGLAALVVSYLQRMPLIDEGRAALHRLRGIGEHAPR